MPLRFLTAGESHGPRLTAILEGMVAGLPLTSADLARDLARRQKGFGRGGRMKIERDRAVIIGGVMAGHTTGGPIALTIENRDWKNWRDKSIDSMTIPRPGHADLTGAIKYGYRDLRLSLERASARETAARVGVGAVCMRYLEQFGVRIGGYVTMIGGVGAPDSDEIPDYEARFEAAEGSEVRCYDPGTSDRMRETIREAIKARDTLGGVFEIVALGLPPGLGSHVQWDRRLTGRLMGALGSIQAMKGVEIGRAFRQAGWRGTKVHDEITLREDGQTLTRRSNRAGGLEGGITSGQPVVARVAMKPISTTLTPLGSVDLASGKPDTTHYERSDFCAVPRAVVVGEAMVALVLADALIEKLGGDSMDEQRPRFEALRQGRLDELPMDGAPWSFGYDT